MSCTGKLPLRNADGHQRVAACRGPEKCKSQLVYVVVIVQSRLAQRLVELLQFGRHHAVSQVHRRCEFCIAR